MANVPEGITSALNLMQNHTKQLERSISSEKPQSSELNGKITPVYGKLAKGQIVHTAFSQYELIKQIGSGGNGRVFSAKDVDGEKFAIKFIDKYQSSTKLKRFKNEINFCEQHKHKNIVEIRDRGYAHLDDKDYVFYVMPLYEETLKDKIKAGIPHEKIFDVFVGLLEGLKFAHQHGSIHRDIKPENIMFAKNSYEPIICDFGIAHFAEEDLLTVIETKATDRMANFQYAAPEQRKRGGNICPQTDIYASALILNEMFTGEIPQAAGYKRIADVNDEYKYFDDLFDSLFKQNPEERLYPEDAILSELKRLAEFHKLEDERKVLQSKVYELILPEEFKALVVSKNYKNGYIVFTLDREIPKEWMQLIKSEFFGHIVGYENRYLKQISVNEIGLPLRGNENENFIKDIAVYISKWIDEANIIYTQRKQQEAITEQRKREEERKVQILKLEKESRLSSIISKL